MIRDEGDVMVFVMVFVTFDSLRATGSFLQGFAFGMFIFISLHDFFGFRDVRYHTGFVFLLVSRDMGVDGIGIVIGFYFF